MAYYLNMLDDLFKMRILHFAMSHYRRISLVRNAWSSDLDDFGLALFSGTPMLIDVFRTCVQFLCPLVIYIAMENHLLNGNTHYKQQRSVAMVVITKGYFHITKGYFHM